MRALLQRVDRASVRVAGREVGRIGEGLLVFLGCQRGDGAAQAERMAGRIARYRIFPDGEGRSNLAVGDLGGAVLLVPQFTLAADTAKGNRPSFTPALAPEEAEPLLAAVARGLRERGLTVAEGVFGAEMLVELVNHGPASYVLEVG